jgi:MFS family permease
VQRALLCLAVAVTHDASVRDAQEAGYSAVLRDREVLALLGSRLVSLAGDQVARVALMVLVFDRTRSATLAAAAYACSYLSAVIAGPLLGGWADRRPRRTVLVTTDLLRAGLFLTMAVPSLPLGVLLLLVVLATALDAPFAAARAALMRDVTGSTAAYQRGTGLDEALDSSGQILGFAAAGFLLVVLSPTAALVLNAASFVVSALVVRVLVQRRAAAAASAAVVASFARRWRTSARRAASDARHGWSAALAPSCRRPVLLTWAGLSCAIAPEALAAPWAVSMGAGPIGVGLLFAAAPVGNIVGVLLIGRVSPETGRRWLLPLTLLSVVPLIVCVAGPSLPVALLLVAVSGVGTSFSLVARVLFVDNVADAVRGRAFSVAATGVMLTQGLGILGAALAALLLPPAAAVAACGAAGLLLIAAAVLASRGRPEQDLVISLVDVPHQLSREDVALTV